MPALINGNGLGAWFGDPDLKAQTVVRMKEHRALDDFLPNYTGYRIFASRLEGEPSSLRGFKGCFLGCLITRPGILAPPGGWHDDAAREFGLTRGVTFAIENLFEGQPDRDSAGDFAVAVVEAIPVGADLRGISPFSAIRASGGDVKLNTSRFLEQLARCPIVEPAAA